MAGEDGYISYRNERQRRNVFKKKVEGMVGVFSRRDRFEIIYRILKNCEIATQKTRIMYNSNLSYEQLQKYIKFLVSINLLEEIEKDGKTFYQINESGKEFIDEYRRLMSMLRTNKTGRL